MANARIRVLLSHLQIGTPKPELGTNDHATRPSSGYNRPSSGYANRPRSSRQKNTLRSRHEHVDSFSKQLSLPGRHESLEKRSDGAVVVRPSSPLVKSEHIKDEVHSSSISQSGSRILQAQRIYDSPSTLSSESSHGRPPRRYRSPLVRKKGKVLPHLLGTPVSGDRAKSKSDFSSSKSTRRSKTAKRGSGKRRSKSIHSYMSSDRKSRNKRRLSRLSKRVEELKLKSERSLTAGPALLNQKGCHGESGRNSAKLPPKLMQPKSEPSKIPYQASPQQKPDVKRAETSFADEFTSKYGNAPRTSEPQPATEDAETRPETGRYRVGLQNIGNTCFMNSILQCLGSTAPLLRYFGAQKHLQDKNRNSRTKGSLAVKFGDLISAFMEGPQDAVFTPSSLKKKVSQIAPRFSGYNQQDSSEFLKFLLDGLHEDLNRIKTKPSYVEIKDEDDDTDEIRSARWWNNYTSRENSYISQLFCGQLKSEVTCLTCGRVSRTFDPFWELSVPIPQKTLSKVNLFDCLRKFVAEEKLCDDYYCSECKKHQSAKKKMIVYRFPQILVITLKRFSNQGYRRSKLTTGVNLPLDGVDFTEFSAKQLTHYYDLYAVSNHMGSLGGGHYTCHAKTNTHKDGWCNFNDSRCSKMNSNSLSSSSAYVLFYHRQSKPRRESFSSML